MAVMTSPLVGLMERRELRAPGWRNPARTLSACCRGPAPLTVRRWARGSSSADGSRSSSTASASRGGCRAARGRSCSRCSSLNRDRPVARDELIDALWPAAPPADPDEALSALLSKVRQAVGRETLTGRRELTLSLPDDAEVDFEQALAASERAQAASRPATRPRRGRRPERRSRSRPRVPRRARRAVGRGPPPRARGAPPARARGARARPASRSAARSCRRRAGRARAGRGRRRCARPATGC